MTHLAKSIPPKTGRLFRVPLFDDVAATCGHGAVQQALDDSVGVRARQLCDVLHGFKIQNFNILALAPKLDITLKRKFFF